MTYEISPVATDRDSQELDQLLWEVLWRPLGLPRGVRESFKLDGRSLELVAKSDGKVVGGLVANWTSPSEAEIRHIAVAPKVQRQKAWAADWSGR